MATGPLWRRVYDGICEGIRSGRWSPGDELPSGQEFAVEFGVSQSTVDAAFRFLVYDGWVWGQPGKARYVADPPPST